METIPEHRRARQHFEDMTREEVSQAVRDMRVLGFSEYCIAAATRLSVEQVRTLLSERP